MYFPIFTDESNARTSDIRVALTLIFSQPEARNYLSSSKFLCQIQSQHSCIVSQISDLYHFYTSGHYLNIEALAFSINSSLTSSNQYQENLAEVDLLDIMSLILNAFHNYSVYNKCTAGEEEDLQCTVPCLLHSVFYLGVTEKVSCLCGSRWENPWFSNNICQYINITDFFEKIDFSFSEYLARIPKSCLINHSAQSNAINLKEKMINYIRHKLTSVKLECSNTDCHDSVTEPKFFVTNFPAVYIIDLINEKKNLSYFETLLISVSITKRFRVQDLYDVESDLEYSLIGIVLLREKFAFVQCGGTHWGFPGVDVMISWEKVIEKILLDKWCPVVLVYKNFQVVEKVDEKKLIKYEQEAVNLDWYFSGNKGNAFIEKHRDERMDFEYREDVKGVSYGGVQGNVVGNYISEVMTNNAGQGNVGNYFTKVVTKKDEPGMGGGMGQHYGQESGIKTWSCECKYENKDDQNVCVKCYKIKPGVDGWVCEKCKFFNERFSSMCYACYDVRASNAINKKDGSESLSNRKTDYSSYLYSSEMHNEQGKFNKEEEVKQDRWICICKEINLNENEVCQKCYELKPGVSGWVCINCKAKNEDYKYFCSICNSTKGSTTIVDQNYWICKKCNSATSSIFSFCSNCHERKSDEHEKVNYKPSRSSFDDWTCLKCNKKNFYSRDCCLFCYNLKDSIPKSDDVVVWKCKNCMNDNYKDSVECSKCSTNKVTGYNKCVNASCSKNIPDSYSMCPFCGYNNNTRGEVIREFVCLHCNKIKDFILCNSCETICSIRNSECLKCRNNINDIKYCSDCTKEYKLELLERVYNSKKY